MTRPRLLSSALLALSLVVAGSGSSWAQKPTSTHQARKKPVKKKKPAPVKKEPKVTPPNAEQKKALGELMGAFKFGMTKDEVIATLSRQIEERYTEQIKGTSDVYAQDKLRKEKNKEITRIKQSYVEFKGSKTGWDVSLIDEEFAHNTGESMLVFWENAGGKNQRRFFFFFEGKLWKMFIAIDTKQLAEDQRNFTFFRQLMEARYGKGAVEGSRETWKTPDFEVQAVDRMAFYGAFALLIQQPSMIQPIQELRVAKAPPKKDKDQLMEVIKEKEGSTGPRLDENKDAVDAIIKGSK
jgi:hypothetical protein